MGRIAVVIALALFTAHCAGTFTPHPDRSASGPSDLTTADFADLVTAASQGDLERAGAIFAQLDRRWSGYEPVQQAFLLGVANLELGRFPAARDYFLAIRNHYPILNDYVRYLLGEAALGAGDTALAAVSFRAVSEIGRSRWRTLARDRLVTTAIAASQWDEARTLLAAMEREAKDPSARRQIQLQAADLAVRRGDVDTASALYLTLYAQATQPSALARIREGLREFREHFHRDLIASLPVDRRLKLARGFLAVGCAEEAGNLLAGVEGDRVDPEYQELLGQANFKARRYPQAAEILCSLADRGGFSLDRVGLLRLCATALARAGKVADAVRRNQQIVTESLDTAPASVALYKIAFLLMDSGQYAKAIPAYRTWLGSRPRAGGDPNDAVWAIAWSHYRLGAPVAARAALAELEQAVGARRDWLGRIAYWRARFLEAEGKKGAAKQGYAAVVREFGDTSYYGKLAGSHLGEARSLFYHQAPTSRRPAAFDLQAPAAKELARLGLWTWALQEDETSQSSPYRVVIEALGPRWRIDPPLVYAMIQQESHFRSDAVSRVGAIGLMQLMPATATQLARQLHWRDFRETDLTQPIVNVQLGMWYMHNLLTQFAGALPMAIASYNAGEEAVRRWIDLYWQRRGKGLQGREEIVMDDFIEEIPFDETIDYVKKILAMYWSH